MRETTSTMIVGAIIFLLLLGFSTTMNAAIRGGFSRESCKLSISKVQILNSATLQSVKSSIDCPMEVIDIKQSDLPSTNPSNYVKRKFADAMYSTWYVSAKGENVKFPESDQGGKVNCLVYAKVSFKDIKDPDKLDLSGMKEWLEHYIFHGAEHFYLLDDESDDSTKEILQPYIEKHIVTWIPVKWDRYLGRQKDIYTHYMLPRIHETKWLLVCDIDEFMWSTQSIDLKTILNLCSGLAEIQVVQTLFGSNGHITQPNSIVKSFTKRRIHQFGTQRTCGYKYFIQSKYPFQELNVHYAIPANEYDKKHRWLILSDEYFMLNHYSSQSKEHFIKKCSRGDADDFKTLTIEDFAEFDINEIDDSRLYEQNKGMIANI